MHRYCRPFAPAILAVSTLSALPGDAEAQLSRKLKDETKQKVESRKARLDSVIVTRAGAVVDSVLEKGGRAVDTAVSRTGRAVDTVLDKTERTIAAALATHHENDTLEHRLVAALAGGRAVIPGVEFDAGSEDLAPSSGRSIAALARALSVIPGTFLVAVHTRNAGDAETARILGERRGAAVKARLIAMGVPAARLFSTGYASVRPPPTVGVQGPESLATRVEVTRLQ
ncbi:MAG: OmpA family protein [Gemmatimonadaceae bacterium]